MDTTQALLALLAVAAFGMMAIVVLAAEQREQRETALNAPYLVSSEGQRRCPKCGMASGWTERACISCGASLGS